MRRHHRLHMIGNASAVNAPTDLCAACCCVLRAPCDTNCPRDAAHEPRQAPHRGAVPLAHLPGAGGTLTTITHYLAQVPPQHYKQYYYKYPRILLLLLLSDRRVLYCCCCSADPLRSCPGADSQPGRRPGVERGAAGAGLGLQRARPLFTGAAGAAEGAGGWVGGFGRVCCSHGGG